MIRVIKATLEDLSIDMLDEYERYTKTTQVLYLKDGQLHQKENSFKEDWDIKRLREISTYLMECIHQQGTVIIAKSNDQVIGFANIEPTIYYNQYVNMPFIHVSLPYRGQGVGQKLFDAVLKEARKTSAKALYISAHPSIETQAFYQSLGCTLARQIIPELYDKEPLDIQLEKEL
jgi:N-acetylglutamate synthase-like GNAT family acetyltransferase